MKRAAMWMSLLVSFVFVGSLLFADDAPKGAGDKPVVKDGQKVKAEGAKDGAVKKEGARLGDIGGKMDKVVGGFSDNQKAEIAKLNKTREAVLKEANDKFLAAAKNLMTEEQKAKWEEATKEGAKKEGQPKEGKGDLGKPGVKEGKTDGLKAGGLKEGGDAAK